MSHCLAHMQPAIIAAALTGMAVARHNASLNYRYGD